jgi:hypothetical protein
MLPVTITRLFVRTATLRSPPLRFYPPAASFSSYRNQQYHKLRKKKKQVDPFQILGIAVTERKDSILFKDVKKTFLRIAMEHHPDTISKRDEESMANSRDIFIAAREAFEQIVEGPNGLATLRSEAAKDSEDFEDWFKQETGHDLPFMDAATMKEVAKMTETVGGGLDRDGGMWTLARMVTNSVKSGGDARDVLRLEAGDGVGNGIDGVLRRRRRR